MKIVSITMVKNEEDIIESFIRYNLNILDEMIILDNGSTDSTLKILKNLKDEDLPLTVLIDEDRYYNQDIKMTKLLYLAFDKYNADIVCVLDADEFISSDNSNPRDILQNIDCNKYYQVKWQTYIPTKYDDYNIDFIPSRINHIRDEKFDRLYKVIVPKEVIKNRNISIEMGNHNLVNINLEPDRSLDLKIAHFPLRSKEQCMSKILVGWPNMILKNKENNDYAVHWKLFFEKIKETGEISYEDLEYFSKNYSLANYEEGIEIYEKTMNIDFCTNIEIKYNYSYNYLRNILDNYVYYVDENIKLNEEIKSLNTVNKKEIKSLNTIDKIEDFKLSNSIIGEKNESYLITVVIPLHNGEKYLRECLDSLVNQTLGIENIEVILVDDLSTDNSVEIINEYTSKYPSIKLIQHTTNLGCGPARNTGLDHTHSDYITYLDCDDYISSNAYERALEIFKNDDDIDLVIYKWEEFNENGLLNSSDIAKTSLKEHKIITNINDYPELIFATFAYIKVYSKRMFEFLDFPSGTYQDNIASARVMINANKIYVADDITVYYRQHEDSISHIISADNYLNILNASKHVIDLRDESPDYYDILSFLALKLVYHCVWYICKSRDFLLKEGEILYPTLKKFPKYFSYDIFEKYQRLFPNYLPCSEQALWDIEEMGFYEYVIKSRCQDNIKSLNNKINSLNNENSNLKNNVTNLEDKNSKLNKKIKSQNKKIKNNDKLIKEIFNSKSWKLTTPLRRIVNFFR
ncbi:Glycosyltransferases involved in cell wall biogenesis [Methanobrevibacter olleyae]|uniref:Glycosyltransferases involved in cell wall biogenesis n=1 Tax=Methanobrevibacter olleyae TaxID=294671 RepID=A0A1I4JJY9_METOL|nr:glycosyltransferase [Methanobrevibacter olleyae]SFL66527.1 Glycosyltransferases involved in cell wall biogenesis [Methanobrevibacter olleyae]